MLKLSWAMLCLVEAICQNLFGHVVGFASPRNALPQHDPDFKWVSASYVGLMGGSSTAITATLGPTSAILGLFEGYIRSFGPCRFGIVKNNPKIHLRNTPPSP